MSCVLRLAAPERLHDRVNVRCAARRAPRHQRRPSYEMAVSNCSGLSPPVSPLLTLSLLHQKLQIPMGLTALPCQCSTQPNEGRFQEAHC